jgi:hypothetical protein
VTVGVIVVMADADPMNEWQIPSSPPSTALFPTRGSIVVVVALVVVATTWWWCADDLVVVCGG